MARDVAIFLDLDNIVIGANEANLYFDINIILDHVKAMTEGRIVLRRAYGDWRQDQSIPRQLAAAGFELQSSVRLSSLDKNLADMQLVVDAVETLIDGYNFTTYVLVTGDRDFVPLVQALRKRGKHVIGIGVRHTTSSSLVNLCDEYIYYGDLAQAQREVSDAKVREWLQQATQELFEDNGRILASVLRDRVQQISNEEFSETHQGKMSFTELLGRFPTLVQVQREGTVVYVSLPEQKEEPPAEPTTELYMEYRSALKKRGLRVVPAKARLMILKDVVALLQQQPNPRWHQIVDTLYLHYTRGDENISKSLINDVLRVARRARVISAPQSSTKPLASLPVTLLLHGDRLFQQAVMLCDYTYVAELQSLSEPPFNVEDAALALYDAISHARYLRYLLTHPPQSISEA